MSLNAHTRHSNGKSPRRKLRLIYRRPGWSLTTAPRYKYFDSLEEAMAYVRLLFAWRRATPGLCGRLEERVSGRWKELPELARVWAEGGWS